MGSEVRSAGLGSPAVLKNLDAAVFRPKYRGHAVNCAAYLPGGAVFPRGAICGDGFVNPLALGPDSAEPTVEGPAAGENTLRPRSAGSNRAISREYRAHSWTE